MKKFTVSVFALLLSTVMHAASLVTLPAGVEPEDYTLKILYSVYQSSGFVDSEKEFTTKVAFSGDEVYVAGLAYYFPDSYVRGTLSGGKVTFSSGQFVGEDMYGSEYLTGYILQDDEPVISDFVFSFDAETRTLTFDGSQIVGETSEPNGGGLYSYVKSAVFTPGAIPPLVKVEVPDDLETSAFLLMGTYMINEDDGNGGTYLRTSPYDLPVQVGFHGDDLYIQGLIENLPQDWVKATKNAAGKYVIPAGQYVGTSNVYNQQFYDYYVASFNRLNQLEDIVLTYDEATNTITTAQTIAMNSAKSSLIAYYYVRDVEIKAIVEKEATPTTPMFSFTREPSPYGSTVWYYADMYIPLTDTKGEPMLSDKLSFMFYCKKNGETLPVVFPASKYYMLKEDMTEIPYNYTDKLDISNHTVYFEKMGEAELQSWTELGMQTIYRGQDIEHRSGIYWFDLTSVWGTGIESVGSDSANGTTSYFDLQGRPVSDNTRGLVLRRMVNADGSVKTVKVFKR